MEKKNREALNTRNAGQSPVDVGKEKSTLRHYKRPCRIKGNGGKKRKNKADLIGKENKKRLGPTKADGWATAQQSKGHTKRT